MIDNNITENIVFLGDVSLRIYYPNSLKNESSCIVILTSPIYMYEMYCQLDKMELSNSIECYALPFMTLNNEYSIDNELLSIVVNDKRPKIIPKTIHSFWFSGEKKPYSYQKCVDTWKNVLDDYEIIEWNQENYDCNCHPFVKKAIEVGAWAYASDYARLDVLYKYGGIYLDQDVEVFRPFDPLLCNDAILSFSSVIQIDLAVMGSKRDNSLIRSLMDIYDSIDNPKSKEGYTKFFQPVNIRNVLIENGLVMNGNLQRNSFATAFPTEFFMPLDTVLFRPYERTENTFCVHYDNFGWSFSEGNKRKKKIHDNNTLWRLME
ncbi:MAG: hypothetical protein K5770_15270 [Lachnospiraceae bacterium]|nr:hypothetical protein [Lachnospiraceae bacterium]